MNISYEGRSVFLTGGSRGIGKKIKEVLETAGAYVVAPGREDLNLLQPETIKKYIENNSKLSPDIFIHCAGSNELAGIDEVSQDVLNQIFQVNIFSAIHLLSAFTGTMKTKGWGRIVFLSSLYSMVAKERRIAYSSSKSALNGLVRTLALELAPENILVNAVAPGYVMTDMTYKNLTKQEITEIKSLIPTGRFQKEEEIANYVAFLCSDLNQSITGQTHIIDGGFICR